MQDEHFEIQNRQTEGTETEVNLAAHHVLHWSMRTGIRAQ